MGAGGAFWTGEEDAQKLKELSEHSGIGEMS